MGEDRSLVVEKKPQDSCRQRTSSVISSCSEDAESESTSGYPPTPDSEELGEELEYGPGIVNKLKTRFLTISLKQNRGAKMSRSCSMENLLDMDEPAVEKRLNPQGPKSLESHWGNLKRAKSMDTLLMDLQNEPIKDLAKIIKGGLSRPVLTICDEELPKPDTVKTYKRMFEPAESRRGSHCRRPPVLRASARSNYATKTNGTSPSPAVKVNGTTTKNRFSAKPSSAFKAQLNGDIAVNGCTKKLIVNGESSPPLSNGCHVVKATPLKINNVVCNDKETEKLNSLNCLLNKKEVHFAPQTDIICNIQKEVLICNNIEETVSQFKKIVVTDGVGKNVKPKVPPNKPSLKLPKSFLKLDEQKVKDTLSQVKLKPTIVNGYKKTPECYIKNEKAVSIESKINNRSKSPVENKFQQGFKSLLGNKTKNDFKLTNLNGEVKSPTKTAPSDVIKMSPTDKPTNERKFSAMNGNVRDGTKSPVLNNKLKVEIDSSIINDKVRDGIKSPTGIHKLKKETKSPSMNKQIKEDMKLPLLTNNSEINFHSSLVNNKTNGELTSPSAKNKINEIKSSLVSSSLNKEIESPSKNKSGHEAKILGNINFKEELKEASENKDGTTEIKQNGDSKLQNREVGNIALGNILSEEHAKTVERTLAATSDCPSPSLEKTINGISEKAISDSKTSSETLKSDSRPSIDVTKKASENIKAANGISIPTASSRNSSESPKPVIKEASQTANDSPKMATSNTVNESPKTVAFGTTKTVKDSLKTAAILTSSTESTKTVTFGTSKTVGESPKMVGGGTSNIESPKTVAFGMPKTVKESPKPASPKAVNESPRGDVRSPEGRRPPVKKASPTSTTSMVFDFRGKDVKSHVAVVPAPFGCKPTPKVRKDVPNGTDEEDEEFVDYSVPPPSGLIFEGENVKIGRGSILSKRNKDLKITFIDDVDGNTFVYPSETSLLEDTPPPTSPAFDAPDASPPPHPSKLKANTALSGTNGAGLSAYTPSVLRTVENFEPGMFRLPDPDSDGKRSKCKENEGDPDPDMLKPADPDLISSWSVSAGTSDLLF